MNPFEIGNELRRRLLRCPKPENGNAPGETTAETFDRVESSYQLNEFMTESYSRRLLKDELNSLLNAGRMGDSLKIHAEK